MTALVIMYLFGGGLDPLFDTTTRAAIERAVIDEARRRAVLAIVDEVEEEWKRTNKALE